MTQWTPKLEKLIQNFADAEDKQLKSTVNAGSTVGALLRFVFNGRAMVSAYKKVCAEAGLKPARTNEVWNGNIKTIVELADKNGSSAAENIKKVHQFAADVYMPFLARHPEVKNPDSLRGAYKLIRAARKEKLQGGFN